MGTRISLKFRIYSLLTALSIVTLLCIGTLLVYSLKTESLIDDIINTNLVVFQTTEELELALANQKGYLSYYFLDENPLWLQKLGEHRQVFLNRFEQAKNLAVTSTEKELIRLIGDEYNSYIIDKDRVINLYLEGEREAGIKINTEVRHKFFKILELCESFKLIFREKMAKEGHEISIYSKQSRVMAIGSAVLFFIFSTVLVIVLIKDVLEPVRKLSLAAERGSTKSAQRYRSGDEIKTLSLSVEGLIKDADQTQNDLDKSRKHLLKSEKLAMVGKLAAGTAHTIRNPLTSVKMRLFSLSRSLQLNEHQKEDFEVITEEIRHIDTIVQNFLEFSRPPKLNIQEVSPSKVIDMAVRLLEHRLKSYNVSVSIIRERILPEIQADPEQLKEVFVNFIVNACEAMEKGGKIEIHETENELHSIGKVITIRISDNGPGIPERIRHKIFDPFFTTKNEGTGLGLSIAVKIIEEHQGFIDYGPGIDGGTSFIIILPIKNSLLARG